MNGKSDHLDSLRPCRGVVTLSAVQCSVEQILTRGPVDRRSVLFNKVPFVPLPHVDQLLERRHHEAGYRGDRWTITATRLHKTSHEVTAEQFRKQQVHQSLRTLCSPGTVRSMTHPVFPFSLRVKSKLSVLIISPVTRLWGNRECLTCMPHACRRGQLVPSARIRTCSHVGALPCTRGVPVDCPRAVPVRQS